MIWERNSAHVVRTLARQSYREQSRAEWTSHYIRVYSRVSVAYSEMNSYDGNA